MKIKITVLLITMALFTTCRSLNSHKVSTEKLRTTRTKISESVVSITRYFTKEEMCPTEPDVIGNRGTAWFISPEILVTIAHVVENPPLPKESWKIIKIRRQSEKGGTEEKWIPIRLLSRFKCEGEDVVTLELKYPPFANIIPLKMRHDLLPNESNVFCFAYPGGNLRCANGKYKGIAGDNSTKEDRRRLGFALLEMSDNNDRLVLNKGASGAPIFDENGNVIAVLSEVIYKAVTIFNQEIQIPISEGGPTNMAVRLPILKIVPSIKDLAPH